MATGSFLVVTICAVISVRGSSPFTLSTEEKSWYEAMDVCTENGSILANTRESNTQIEDVLKESNVSDVWTSDRTFLSYWVANQGCHWGNLTNILGKKVTSPKVGQCQQHCQSNGSGYFSIQRTDVCKCLDPSTVLLLSRTHDSLCNVTCGEGQEQGTTCGGVQENVVSLYRTSGLVEPDTTEALCRVFKKDTDDMVNLYSVPCDSQINSTACVIYNETTGKDELNIYRHNGKWDYATQTLCYQGYIPALDNATKMELLERAKINDSIWSGYIRQRIDLNDSDIDVNTSSYIQCYAQVNGARVRANCTEERRFICRRVTSMNGSDPNSRPTMISNPTMENAATTQPSSNNKRTDRDFKEGFVTPPTTVTTTRRRTTAPLPKPFKSSREDTKIIGIVSGIAVGCIVVVVVTAVAVYKLCKRSVRKKGQKKKRTKNKPVKLKDIVVSAELPKNDARLDSSTDESEDETKFTVGDPSGGVPKLPSVSYNYDTVCETGADKGHVNDAYAYAETKSTSSDEGLYNSMELLVDASDDDDLYATTMLPLPDNDVKDDVAMQPDGDTYDVMNSKVRVPGNESAYDHTTKVCFLNGATVDTAYDVFNRKVMDGVEDTYDHTQSSPKNGGDLNNSAYDVFNKKNSGKEDSGSMYDSTRGATQCFHAGGVTSNDIYDTCNEKPTIADDVDDLYDHASHTRANQDENLYDLTPKHQVAQTVNDNPYDRI
ncbi:uncharacterized protein LOC132554643 [Ylistrum balloti]|uniref:uncharacterized protein LOC132554643 n=1 Tax=Ylistrum balloti TaxID=509963 RepID=UPI002905818D|nr:uncharacterized protein LOC132554643 [Ylistrum balloti]